jgi:uncharacterized protein YbcI
VIIEQSRETGELLAAISNMVVGVYANCLGRGPTRARSYINHDIVLCVLEDSLTKPERHLRDVGHQEHLIELRQVLQETMQVALIKGMEQLVRRHVKTLISGSQLDPDVSTEVFILGEELDGDTKPQVGEPASTGEKQASTLSPEPNH